MKPVMYIFANKELAMTGGKLAAQVAHAAVNAFAASQPDYVAAWQKSGYTKIVLEARDTEHLRNIQEYLSEKGFATCPIIDEGRTEIAPHSFTALGVTIVDKDSELVQFAFSDFRTYRDPKPDPVPKRKFWPGSTH